METLILYVVMNKVNFTQLGRFGNHTEKGAADIFRG